MNGFKNTKTGPIYGDFNLSKGTPKCGEMPQRFATGGLVSRAEPSNELDAESGGKTPLRPGYSRGGKAKKKYAEGGKVGALRGVKKQLAESRKKAEREAFAKSFTEEGRDTRSFNYGNAKVTPTRDAKTGRFAKGGMVGCGFNRTPMIGK